MAQQSESEGDEERQRLADRVLGRLEDAVYWGIALVLIIGSVALTVAHMPQAALNVLIVGLLVLAVDVVDTLMLTRDPSAIA